MDSVNREKAAVAAIVHQAKGMSFKLDEGDMREWSWWVLVAQSDPNRSDGGMTEGPKYTSPEYTTLQYPL